MHNVIIRNMEHRKLDNGVTVYGRDKLIDQMLRTGVLQDRAKLVALIAANDRKTKPQGKYQAQGVQQQQTSRLLEVMGWHAMASVTGGNPPVYLRQRGFSSAAIARGGAGSYTHTCQEALDMNAGDGILLGTCTGAFAVGSTIQLQPQANDTDIVVTLATLTAVPAAAAADINYCLGVLPIGPN